MVLLQKKKGRMLHLRHAARLLIRKKKKSESKEQNGLKIIQPFINPSSCYIAAKKSQQIFHTTFVINFIIKNLILAGTNKNCQLVRENY